jgi:hypothetical protein
MESLAAKTSCLCVLRTRTSCQYEYEYEYQQRQSTESQCPGCVSFCFSVGRKMTLFLTPTSTCIVVRKITIGLYCCYENSNQFSFNKKASRISPDAISYRLNVNCMVYSHVSCLFCNCIILLYAKNGCICLCYSACDLFCRCFFCMFRFV